MKIGSENLAQEESESAVLMVREGRDLLQHLQLSPWPENVPAVSICVGARSLLVQTDCAEGGIKFLVELEESEDGITFLLKVLHISKHQAKRRSPTWWITWLGPTCKG